MRFAIVVALAVVIYGGRGVPSPAADDSIPSAGVAAGEDYEGLPAGPGREEVFYLCRACHSLKIVLQQRLSREVWDETLVWMIEEQGMPAPEPADYARLLDYLGSRLSPEAPR